MSQFNDLGSILSTIKQNLFSLKGRKSNRSYLRGFKTPSLVISAIVKGFSKVRGIFIAAEIDVDVSVLEIQKITTGISLLIDVDSNSVTFEQLKSFSIDNQIDLSTVISIAKEIVTSIDGSINLTLNDVDAKLLKTFLISAGIDVDIANLITSRRDIDLAATIDSNIVVPSYLIKKFSILNNIDFTSAVETLKNVGMVVSGDLDISTNNATATNTKKMTASALNIFSIGVILNGFYLYKLGDHYDKTLAEMYDITMKDLTVLIS